jgi:dethiobiotin synthetase
MRGVFVTGTDTNVGKTVVSAALMARYPAARYWKPVQTGIERDDDTAEVQRLSGGQAFQEGIRLRSPVSPHLAARRAQIRIELRSLRLPTESGPWVIEGAGGVLVPLNDSENMADLMAHLGLPVVVAARSALGTINHTLLTLKALRARGLRAAGIVMVGAPDRDNREAIEHWGGVPVLGEMPHFDPLTPSCLQSWAVTELDPRRTLAEFLA